jgi:CDP-diacylglycerol--serine O-phosphatidyltransferase
MNQVPRRDFLKPGAVRRLRARLRPRPRYRGPSFNRLIPNLMTMLGLCAGLVSIRFALEGRFEAAAGAIVVAAFIDGLDGRLARLLRATSRFGAEFDSLSDFLCFGVAPALILYVWSLQEWGAAGYAPCLLFAVCMALRLARFNAGLDGAPKPAYAAGFFTGVPAPAGAGLALLPLFAGLAAASDGYAALADLPRHPAVVATILVAVAALLISTLPTWAFKNFKVPAEHVLPALLGTGALAVLLASAPWAALALVGLIYAGMLPFSVRSYRRLKAEAEAMRGGLADPPEP